MAQPVGTKRGPYKHHQPPRKCQFPGCEHVYVPENANQRYCKSDHFSRCVICGSLFKVKNLSAPSKTCSAACGRRLNVLNRAEGYSEAWKQKCRSTNLERRGVLYPMQSAEAQRKSKETSFQHYGTASPMQSKVVKDKLSATLLARYGVQWACQLKQCASNYRTTSKICQKIVKLFESSGLSCELEFPIDRYKYDIHIADTNVLIEVNPTITHNSRCDPWGSAKSATYHRDKFETAYRHKYICFNIWDWTDAIDLLHGLLYSKYFSISDLGQPTLHYYNDAMKSHTLDDIVSEDYLPVYDEGYSIEFIY